MDNNEEKKPKRPRIGENRIAASSDVDGSYGKANYNHQSSEYSTSGEYGSSEYGQERSYQPRPYNNRQAGYNGQRGYNNRYNNGGYRGGYNNRYNQGSYQHRQYQDNNASVAEGVNTSSNHDASSQAEGFNGQPSQEGGYQPRPYNNRQGGYNNRYNNYQGGYNNRQGGYGNRPQQGGYNNYRGGYGNRPQQGGYNNRQGGYGNRPQQGGYNNRQGGYDNRPQQGGYNGHMGGRFQQNRRPGYNQQPRQGKSFTPRPKRIEYEMPIPDPNEQIRLNKFMANAGICSRREADEFIQQGLVKVNGQVVTELGVKISHSDTVEYDEKIVALESKCYILLNKPKDCVTTSDDPNGRTTVLDLVKGACTERIYPVGRLDRNTTGVLLLTNDGDLASKLTHPKYVKKKIYHVWTDKDISEDDMQAIADGIELEDGPIHADAISYATETDRNQAGIEIHSGRNRIVRRIFEHLGYHVTKLDRVYFAGLTKKNLPRGRWRYLTQEEVNFLKMGSFE